MRLNVTALAVAFAVFWGGAILLLSVANLLWPPCGGAFLEVVASMYPGYAPGTGAGSVLTGTFYGLLDGAFGGLAFGWVYNSVAVRFGSAS